MLHFNSLTLYSVSPDYSIASNDRVSSNIHFLRQRNPSYMILVDNQTRLLETYSYEHLRITRLLDSMRLI